MTEKPWKDIDGTEGRPLVPAPACARWFVATCQSGGESGAVAGLHRFGHAAWFPQMTRWNLDRMNRRRVKINRALFPGYIFVEPGNHAERGVTECGKWIKWLAGDHRSSEIEARIVIRLSDQQGNGKFIDWRNAPDRPTRMHAIGSKVELEAGAMPGFIGIVEMTAGDRITVLLDLMGRAVRVSVGSGEARKVA